MMKSIQILQPKTSEEVCLLLDQFKGKAVIHAGGTDLLVRMRKGFVKPSHIIDLSKTEALGAITELPDGSIRIGCMVTITELMQRMVTGTEYQALFEALQSIGSVQIRNRGTIVGNICNASPAADSALPLLVFDSTLNIRGVSGLRTKSITEFFRGPGETCLALDEFVESIELPCTDGRSASAFQKIGRRKAVDCSLVGVAVRIDSDKCVRIALGAVADRPFRADTVETLLSQNNWEPDVVSQAAKLVEAAVSPIDDVRASKSYRKAMSSILFRKTFEQTVQRFQQEM